METSTPQRVSRLLCSEMSRGETNRAHSERTTLDDVLIAVIYFAREATRYQAICIADCEQSSGTSVRRAPEVTSISKDNA